jgi:hypothetical protein
MTLPTWRAVAGGLGAVALLGLTGCEYTTVYEAECGTSLTAPPDQPGVVTMTADVPLKVEAGSTFTISVEEVGAGLGLSEDPPPATYAWLISTRTEPGRIDVGSVSSPAQWPQEIELTVTGQPGETVLFGVVQARQVYGTAPDDDLVWCTTASSEQHGLFAEIPIVEPET